MEEEGGRKEERGTRKEGEEGVGSVGSWLWLVG